MKKEIILTSTLPLMMPIIKIVGDWCNLGCDYCFYYTRDQTKKTVMNYDVLEKFIKEYLDFFEGYIRFTWHGGEPLLAGIPFFEKIIEFQHRYCKSGQKILNTLQTNGTLINKNWAEFFRKYNFRIGISIDGTKEKHNRFRKDKNGKDTFGRVVKGLKILQENKVPVGILHVLTRSSLSTAKENLDFFVNTLGIKRISGLIYYPSGNNLLQKEKITNQELIRFYRILVDFWLSQGDSKLQIREIENFVAGIMGKQASLCFFGGTCTAFFCLEHDGKIYPCDKLSGKSEFCWGDLSKQSLIEILNSKKRLKYAEKVNSLSVDCFRCKWQKACHNGCPVSQNSNGKYYFCKARKDTFSYLSAIIKDFLDKNKIG